MHRGVCTVLVHVRMFNQCHVLCVGISFSRARACSETVF